MYGPSDKKFFSYLCQGIVRLNGKKNNYMCHGLAVAENQENAEKFARFVFSEQYGCEPAAVSVIGYEIVDVLALLED